jgi:hypothetical protein
MVHIKLYEDFSDPGMGIPILNVDKKKMETIKNGKNVVVKKSGVVAIVANELSKKLGFKKPFDAFKTIYKSEDTLAFALKHKK